VDVSLLYVVAHMGSLYLVCNDYSMVWVLSTHLNFYILLLSYMFIVSLLFLCGAGNSKAYSNIFCLEIFS
jgi:hypothetical protein